MPPTIREQSRTANRKGLIPIIWPTSRFAGQIAPWPSAARVVPLARHHRLLADSTRSHSPTTPIYIRRGRAAAPLRGSEEKNGRRLERGAGLRAARFGLDGLWRAFAGAAREARAPAEAPPAGAGNRRRQGGRASPAADAPARLTLNPPRRSSGVSGLADSAICGANRSVAERSTGGAAGAPPPAAPITRPPLLKFRGERPTALITYLKIFCFSRANSSSVSTPDFFSSPNSLSWETLSPDCC